MDGDRARLGELDELAHIHDALLYVDEAHAVGGLGPKGRGLAEETGIRPAVTVGTLGKSFGSFGAYVSGPRPLAEFLLHRARSFVFTTGLPAAVVAASRAGLRIIAGADGETRRVQLRNSITHLRELLANLGLLAPGAGSTPIFPILIGDERTTMELTAELLSAGIYVQGIRPPTVPPGSSRLRIAVSALHQEEHLHRLADALAALRSQKKLRTCST
jgi:7-keto-8-aminopelargonate synthetase-like enzyme